MDANSESVLTSCVFVGMILGSSFWGALSDTRGRRPAFLFTALGSAAFAYLSAAAPNFYVRMTMPRKQFLLKSHLIPPRSCALMGAQTRCCHAQVTQYQIAIKCCSLKVLSSS